MNYSDLFIYVAPYVGNCPRMVMEHHIRLATIDFCRRTHAWMDTLADIPTVNGTGNYALGLPTNTDLVRIFTVDIGTALDVPVLSEHKARLELSRQRTALFAWTPDLVSLSINPPSTVDGDVIKVQVSIKPSLASTSFPDVIGNHHGLDIAHGALASLLSMPKVDWRDTQEADRQLIQSNAAISKVARQKTKGYATQETRVTRFY